MRTKASTAALRQVCKRLLLHPRRASRHPASGRAFLIRERKYVPPNIRYWGATGYFGRGGMGL
jgi:hypothetical protein